MQNNNVKIKLCPICIIVSGLWLLLSAGVAWGFLSEETYIIPIALLMGGSVIGIAHAGEKRFLWPAKHQTAWKAIVTALGMPTAYYSLTNLSKTVMAGELIALTIIAYLFFSVRGQTSNERVRELEDKMKQCC
ncbi:MAG: hypothetical protein A2941_01405 [Candidatus Yanofskybacteria bacterium RIFCSPLOWO2_01_FULL_49_17]|uniref:Uncharacterized protein n=1 Tax=Candidatus Yanofskybacteria bacterium RIFCSPLOWO2_01_FULL_49_17 TaxID=1802700 RepID=A0A1F8GRL1_9BACT|nr:MAG: hypothetical protein A2941_01405 [Candidatus Yanofskybacteria bacterium RIFCSPLOWO2_01_FULL_49_17]